MDLSVYNRNNQIDLMKATLTKPNTNRIIDILPLITQFIVYEDLFETSISAKIIIADQLSLVGSLPIVGGEVIDIQYRTPVYKESTTLQLIVYKVGERGVNTDSENLQVTQLFLCTPEAWFDSNMDVSSGIRGTYSDIIGKLLKETQTKKTFTSEESVGIVDYAAPVVGPFTAIKFCASRANSKTFSPMFFWETTQGYQLKSLKEIYRAEHSKFLYIEDRSVAGADKDADKAFNTCFNFEYLESNNRLAQYKASAFGSDTYMVDNTNRRVVKVRNSYDDVYSRLDIKLNKFPLNDSMKNNRADESFLPYRTDLSHLSGFNRLSNLTLMDNIRVMVNIPGDSQLKAGDVVWMEIPARVGLDVGVEKLSAGKWLVRSLKHLITKNTYSMILELTKDSFDIDVTK